jgi:hypothetical protein
MMKALHALVAAAAVSCVMVSGAANAEIYTSETYTIDLSVDGDFLYVNGTKYAWEDEIITFIGETLSHYRTAETGSTFAPLSVTGRQELPVRGGDAPFDLEAYLIGHTDEYNDTLPIIGIYQTFHPLISAGGGTVGVVDIYLGYAADIYPYNKWYPNNNTSWVNFGGGEIPLGHTDYTGIYDSNLYRGHYTFYTDGSPFQSAHLVFTTNAVPEPETYAMLLAGLGIVGAVARRRSKRG